MGETRLKIVDVLTPISNFATPLIEEHFKLGKYFRIQHDQVIKKDDLERFILDAVKQNERQDEQFQIDQIVISPYVVLAILKDFCLQGLVEKEGNFFIPNIQKLISIKEVEEFCCHRVDAISVQDIVEYFGFRYRENPSFNQATLHSALILNQLVKQEILLKNCNRYFFNFDLRG